MSGSRLAPDDDQRERRPGMRALGAAVSRVAGAIVARHGGGILARLKAEWASIVGPELADSAWPEALARGGTLRLRVAPHRALEIQHRTPLVMERINLFFGRDAVTRLALVQGPLPRSAPTAKREPERALSASQAAALHRQLGEITDPELRAALDRLGRAVIATTER